MQSVDVVRDADRRPLVVRPLMTDARRNRDDITVDDAAIASGVEHGGTIETRAERLQARGAGGRKRSGARGGQRSGPERAKKGR
jgi:hypothetical protein